MKPFTRLFFIAAIVAILTFTAGLGFIVPTPVAEADDPGNPAPPTMTFTPTATLTPTVTPTVDNKGEGNPDHGQLWVPQNGGGVWRCVCIAAVP